MKTNKFFALAAIVCGFALSFTSCSEEDNPVGGDKITVTIGFENATLNNQGFWCGDETGTPFDNWGSEAFKCFYTEAGVPFEANYTPAWASWSGFAISNRTETTFNAATMTPDQFNNIAGGAHSGKNFCVVYTYGEKLEFASPVTVKGFWYTNDAWTVDAILNGDGMTPGKFEADDYLTCVLYPTPAEGVGGARYELSLAKDGDYVKEWKYCDLSDVDAFKNIKSLSFAFEGSKANDYGVTTPTYICIDDIVIEK
ncbi:MAG: DUF4465 domain-containing protein [Prevotella sp.]|nr:DUF4465 domain-containing protein [Prevotella sp.]